VERKQRAAGAVGSWKRPEAMRQRPAKRQSWTPEHDRVVLRVRDDGEVAEQLGRTRASVMMRRWRLGGAPGDGT
jgi:hypothetical protein